MIIYKTANSKNDLEGILDLQKANLAQSLTPDEIENQGFVTVHHSYEQLEKLNNIEKHVIAKDDDRVIGYLLAMTQKSKHDIPVLVPMFDAFNAIFYKEKKIAEYNYIVVGQVCVDKSYRGQGILDDCYDAYKKIYEGKYDFAITEIAATNSRSLNAHARIGFKQIHSYYGLYNEAWIVVIRDWKKSINKI
ncbi:MAG TPA: GNAT family N-acetyltransferase [Puia sp.]|nr:GNAT family N-acetyltransferase [Puia sp.]